MSTTPDSAEIAAFDRWWRAEGHYGDRTPFSGWQARASLSASPAGGEPVAWADSEGLAQPVSNERKRDLAALCPEFAARYTVPLYTLAAPPAPALPVNAQMLEALKGLLKRDERNTCQHENTHRGGAIWEICDDCDAKWADDEGGRPEWSDPAEWTVARATITAAEAAQAQPEVAPLTMTDLSDGEIDRSLTAVTKEDANNYCRILTALGMEEEGDPVAAVEQLVARCDALEEAEFKAAQALPAAPAAEVVAPRLAGLYAIAEAIATPQEAVPPTPLPAPAGLPENATEPMQMAMQRAVMLRKSMNDVWRAALSELRAEQPLALTPLPAEQVRAVPLTDEQLDALATDGDGLPNSHLEFARAIERAHGITGEQHGE